MPNKLSVVGFVSVAVVGAVVLAAALSAPAGFILMLSMGIMHSKIAAWPVLGFWEAYVIAWTVTMVFGSNSSSSSK